MWIGIWNGGDAVMKRISKNIAQCSYKVMISYDFHRKVYLLSESAVSLVLVVEISSI